MLAVVAAAAGAAALTVVLTAEPQRTAMRTTVGGLAAGDLDRAALEALLRRTAAQHPPGVTVVLGSRRATVPVERLGLALDVPQTVDRALRDSGNGRRWGVLDRSEGQEVVPVLTRDSTAFGQAVASLVRTAAVAESVGDLHYVRGQVLSVPATDGQSAAVDVVRTALLSGLRRLPWPTTLTVPVEQHPAGTTQAELDSGAAQAQALLSRPLVLRAAARERTVTAAQLGPELTLVRAGAPGQGLRPALRPSARDRLADPVARLLSLAPRNPKVEVPTPTALLADKGSTQWRPVAVRSAVSAPGAPGQRVGTEAVLDAVRGFVAAGGAVPGAVVVPAEVRQPQVTDAAARSIDAVLGTFTTSFSCCQPRVANIALMARTVDGTLVAQGQSFSLNGIVGPRTRAKGYVEAPYILDGELSTDVGGGVSQFATTTLNAAFFAGLRLDRHQPHSFYISRYPAGREATVNYPTIDLRWTNDSSGPVLVRTLTTGTSLTVTLYGRGDGRTVSAETGPRVAVPGRDFRITVTRIVTRPGVPARRESFTTTYNKPPEHD